MIDAQPAWHSAERVARESFGKLTSWLLRQWRDFATVEDALSEALLKALELWPLQGVPTQPEAWLLTVAKRQLLQAARSESVRNQPELLAHLAQLEADAEITELQIPDERLKLMFVCAHPAIDPRLHTALMLQTVLGLQVDQIAPAMLLSSSALAQKLVRAKQKIKLSGIAFEVPEAAELPERLHAVLEAIYAAFGMSMDSLAGSELSNSELRSEALFLCQLLCQLMPEASEAMGLYALMQFRTARAPAQTDTLGAFVPLAQQRTEQWDHQAIVQADQLLMRAASLRRPGPFQWEAAIQSAHCHRHFFGFTPWRAIAQLYAQLNQSAATIGSLVAQAVALKELGDLPASMALLEQLDHSLIKVFQPWWVAKAHVLAAMHRHPEAIAHLDNAIGLTEQAPIKRYLCTVRESWNALTSDR